MNRSKWTGMVAILVVALCQGETKGLHVASLYEKSYRAEAALDYAGAMSALGEVVATWPNGYTVNVRLGWLNYLSGRYGESRACYEKARSAMPTSIEALLGLANVALAQGKYETAEGTLKKVLEMDPLNYTAGLKRSLACRMLKKPKEAEAIARKLLAYYPADVSLLVEYGWARWAVGDLTTATAVFNDVLTLDSGNAAAKSYFSPLPAGAAKP